jgi:hypothetical protein
MRNGSCKRLIFLFAIWILLPITVLKAQGVTKVADNGPDGQKLTFVVLGDGYDQSDQVKFAEDVERLVVKGVLGHDFYKDNFAAFNVYRIDLVSKDSGVSHPGENRDTALRVIYSGDWNRCWLEESPETDQRIVDATAGVNKFDFVLVIANEGGYGGCQRGGRLYITAGDDWDVVSHEYGHGIAGLYDEYSVSGSYTTPPINVKNCSTVKDRKGVSWSRLINQNTPVPTDSATALDPNQTVGLFTGCDYAVSGIYRPVQNCRMKTNTPGFCPVCLGLMNRAIARYLPAQAGAAGSAAPPPQTSASVSYVSLVIKLTKNGDPKILRARQTSGILVTPANIPSYLFAFTKKEKPAFVGGLSDSPFVIRGFIDPYHPEKGEKLAESDSSTVIVSVPDTDMSSATHDLGMRIFSVEPAGMRAFANTAENKYAELLKNLLNANALALKANVPASKLGGAVQSIQ